jgi:CDP-diacylglycerol---serine O-phosphatidyltransferase
MLRHIPNLLTLGNLACGFVAIAMGDFYWSPILIVCSFILDGLDGIAARWLKATSEIGKQLDSLCDIVSFGVAPAYLYFLMAPDTINYMVIFPMILVVAGAYRLAMFNTLPSLPYFKGLPIPSNAIFFTGIIFADQNNVDWIQSLFDDMRIYIAVPIIFSILMVSFGFRMFSIKSMTRNWKDNVFHILMAVVGILILIFYKKASMPLIIIAYILLSIIYHFMTPKSDKEVQMS